MTKQLNFCFSFYCFLNFYDTIFIMLYNHKNLPHPHAKVSAFIEFENINT